MFGQLMDMINEMQNSKLQNGWIGNERYAELKEEFEKMLEQYVDKRIKIALQKLGMI